ncbi:MAG TPA: GIY-YIG nuclease family protein [Archangium sp.]|nr:GIY-YIG nuclease family protein [Archangium sp.]
MCDGRALSAAVDHWIPIKDAAQDEAGPFSGIPASSGVYVLRVSKVGTTDLDRVKEKFSSSRFMKIRDRMDDSSGAMFTELGLGEGQGWTLSDFYRRRLARVDRIAIKRGTLTCPIIYIGKANSLQRRLNELAFDGHTINAPFWALLMSGWEFEVGCKKTRKKAETSEEARLKSIYRDLHGNGFPPLVQR